MNTLETIALSVLASGSIVTIFELTIKLAIKNRFEKELEAFKNDLRHKSELAIKDLEHKANERSIKLTRVFEVQAEVIAETFGKFVLILQTFEEYASYMRLQADFKTKGKIFYQTVKDFEKYYEPKRLYILKPTQTKLDNFLLKLHEVYQEFLIKIELARLIKTGVSRVNRLTGVTAY